MNESYFSCPANGHRELEGLLRGSETLIWTGMPKQGLVFRIYDVLLVPIGFILVGFMAMVFFSEANKGTGSRIVTDLLFLFAGIYLLIGRFIYYILLRRTTFYGLSQGKVFIVSGVFSRTKEVINLRFVSKVELIHHLNGLGSIRFPEKMKMTADGRFNPNSMHDYLMHYLWTSTHAHLEFIPKPREVYQLVLEQQKNSRGTSLKTHI